MTHEERRAEIMKCLGDVLRERSLASLTMQDVADKLGMTKGNLYHYFSSKQDLLYQSHMKGMVDHQRLLAEARRAKGPAAERLSKLLDALVRTVAMDPNATALISAIDDLTPEQRDAYLAHREAYEACVRELIDEGVKSGEFAPIDSKIASFILLGAVNSVTRWFKPDGPRSPDYVAEIVAQILTRGLKG